ncbi:Rab-3-interacting molecule unc-10 [Caenorhabditis elegans]|uniref:Rab-3-interacting molecule unc-10 n=1 Tax=Caenorhabditis elegans TaxID=6239 RepID=A0A5E4LWH4_CAEEL|nr:Rab-3-interacting molecule unc-10 [Caenorhabditis elegans]VVC12381.1 Rab-3-interacting molecule unc-10 [Caenorhabditis elegans]
MDDPSMMPDLSHLSAEEREIIENVFKRQKDEEAKETQISQKASEELSELDKQITERKETSKKLVGTQDDAICQICQKTKFADGIGHKCFYCQLRSCARCGGRAQSKNKAIWACSLCQKRQQILAKTGKWFQPEEQPQPKISGSEPSPSPQPLTDDNVPEPQQRRAEPPDKMNTPNYQNNQQPRGMGMQPNHNQTQQNFMNQNQNSNQHPNQNHNQNQMQNPHQNQNHVQNNHQGANNHQQNNRRAMQQQPMSQNQANQINQMNQNQNQQQSHNQNMTQNQRNQTGPQNQQRTNDSRTMKQTPQQQPSQYQNNVGAAHQHHNQHGQQEQHHQQMNEQRTDNNRMRENTNGQGGMFNRQPSLEQTTPMNKYNHVEDDGMNQRPTFYTGNSENDQRQFDGQMQQGSQQNNQNQNQNNRNLRKNTVSRVTEEDYASSSNFESKKQRNNSSQSQSNTQGVRACPSTDDHLNRVKNRLHRQLRSMSSSEEDIIAGGGGNTLKMSTSAVVASGGKTAFHDDMGASNVQRLSEECNSEKDLLRYIYGDHKNSDSSSLGAGVGGSGGGGVLSGNSVLKNMQANRRRDKSLSLSPSRNDHFGTGSISGGDLLASRIRTFLSHPVTWQPSADQKKLIGHMILHRTENSAANGDLGLKIVGGRRTDTGKLGAFITQVKPGSVADTIGRLRPGDEVVEWNGQSLQNATYEQVYDSIAASRYDTSVELIVSRSAIIPGGDDFLNLTPSQMSSSAYSRVPSAYPSQFQRQLPNPDLFLDIHPALQQLSLPHSQSAVFPHNNTLTSRNRSTSSYYYSDVPDLGVPSNREMQESQAFGTGHIFGRIEVSFVYSHHDRQLSVALVRGFDLPPRSDGTPRNPYVKIFLLPDRSEKSRRQSAVIAETLMPVWDEVFYYNGLTEPMLLQRVLELTVWDYDKFGTNSFLGETLIDLASVPLDGEHSLMCILVDMDDDNPLRTRLKLRKASYNAPTRRPQSELNYYDHSSNYYDHISQNIDKQPHHHHLAPNDEENDEYIDDDELENDIDLATGGGARKSRTYRREKGMHGGHGYADWTQNHQRQSGYTSDHGYGRQNMIGRAYNRRQQRRPRSATALSQMEREDMYDPTRKHRDDNEYSMRESVRHGSQYYLGDQPLYEDGRYKISQGQMTPKQHNQQHQPHPLSQAHQQQQTAGVQPQHHQGFQQQQHPQQPNQQMQQMQPPMPNQGYYSDGSETLSVHSTNSMPTTMTTVNRRNMNANNTSNDNTSFAETPTANTNRVPIKETKQNSLASSSSVAGGGSAANNVMKERKKSLMTRFIPGRGAEGKRTGFARSEEVGIPGNLSSDRLTEPTPPFLKQASKESTDSAHSDNWLPVLADGPLGTFVDNLGPGQVVGRQVLASPVLGEIQIALMAGRSGIDVEIIKAKNLVVKPGVKVCPAPYVKVYLMEGKQCIAKAKTNAATKTTSPLFQQHLIFNDSPKKKTLQVTVLGDYGRMERKVFMGISQIRLEDLELGSQPLIGWYKLFHSSSLAGTGPVRKDSDVSVGGAQQ